MDLLAGLFVVTICLVAVLAWAAIRSSGRTWRKVVALGALAALVPIIYVDVIELLGRPKPTTMEWIEDFKEGLVVVGADIREGHAIYLWVRMRGELEPRAYELPWDPDTATSLKETSDLAQDMATDVMVKLSEEVGTIDRQQNMVFYAEPQQPLPDKPDPGEPPGMLLQPSVAPVP